MAANQLLQDKVAIVTGGASGIGKMTVLTLAGQGARVTIADVNLQGAQAVAEEARSLGSEALAVETDVSRGSDVTGMVDQALATFGKIDILVNDAATSFRESIAEVTEEHWDRVLAVNLKGPMLCCKAVLPHMQQRKSGAIVNVSSGSGFRPAPKTLAYACSKAAIAHLSRSLAFDLASDNIRVNTVAPGLTDTPMTRKNWPTDEEMKRTATASHIRNPMGVVLEPRDLANAVLFLVSDAARYITGQTLHVNAGSWLS
ncbi:MAG: SDR family oxidoreductase [Dehalococcoidia bacterium]